MGTVPPRSHRSAAAAYFFSHVVARLRSDLPSPTREASAHRTRPRSWMVRTLLAASSLLGSEGVSSASKTHSLPERRVSAVHDQAVGLSSATGGASRD